jgi:hypothetical protein
VEVLCLETSARMSAGPWSLGNGTRDFSRGLAAECVWVQVSDIRQETESFPVCGHKADMALERYSRLHHEWRPGAASFVTWRLYGSLPVSRLLDACATGPKWLGHRQIAGAVAGILHRGQVEGRFESGAWVLMPNHLHLLFRPTESLASRYPRL